MKISLMNNVQAADALIRISEPMGNILDDQELVSMLDELNKMNDLGIVRAVGKLMPKFVGYALKKHRKDLFEIIGALENKPIKEVEQMNFMETVKVVRDSYDDVLKDFFTGSAVADKTAQLSQG